MINREQHIKDADEAMRKILTGTDTKALVRYLRESPTSIVMAAAADKIEELEAQLEAIGAGGVTAGQTLMGGHKGEPKLCAYCVGKLIEAWQNVPAGTITQAAVGRIRALKS